MSNTSPGNSAFEPTDPDQTGSFVPGEDENSAVQGSFVPGAETVGHNDNDIQGNPVDGETPPNPGPGSQSPEQDPDAPDAAAKF